MSFSLSARSLGALAGLAFTAVVAAPASAQSPATGALINGKIEELILNNPNDVWSGGRMVVGGQIVIIPRNLILQLPANWLTLQQLFDQAPAEAKALGKSGLAALDGVGTTGFATVTGNRTSFGNVIAGDIFIEKGVEVVNGVVTFIDYTDGYVRLDGAVGDSTTGVMVRFNDPDSRHSIQQGLGCNGGPNCSADPRFTLDPDNYTISFSTGYPAGIPSTVPVGQRLGFTAGDNAAAAADASGVGDPFCPATNRGTAPVADSRLFAPIQLGDSLVAEGNYEDINGVHFLSAHTVNVLDGLTTLDSPDQPDYITFDEVEWDVGAFGNQRQRLLLIGFSTLPTSELDVFSLQVDPNTNENNEFIMASTVGNPQFVNQGVGATAGGIWKIRYDVDFAAATKPDLSPCQTLLRAGFNVCPLGGNINEELGIINPISREIIAHSRHVLNPGIITRDVNGNEATNGLYLTPIGVGFPEFVEINLGALQTPYSFDGLPWNMDRRLSPVGCVGACESTPQPLVPFPWSGVDPRGVAPAGIRNEIFAFFPFGPTNQLAWPPLAPASFPINPTPVPIDVTLPAPVADFSVGGGSGVAPLTVSFTNLSTGSITTQLWDFGDGTFSIEPNPVHTYLVDGSFSVTLSALGLGGSSTVTKAGAVVATPPGGPGAPVADFSADVTAGNIPLAVNFSDLSTGDISSWAWTFGDGATSTLQSPSHTYSVAGLYSVSLTVTGPGGSNTLTRNNLINANELGGLQVDFVAVGATTGPAPLRVRLRAINITGVATSGTFDFGDGTTGTVSAGNGRIAHTYQAPGVYTVTLTATDGVNTDIVQKVDFVTVQ